MKLQIKEMQLNPPQSILSKVQPNPAHNPVVREWVKIVVVYLMSQRKLHYLYINASDCQNPVMDMEDDRVEEVRSREDEHIEVERRCKER